MRQRFDFSEYYLKETLSDVTILIRADGQVQQRLPGHGVVLANVSDDFKQRIEQQQRGGGCKPTVILDVRPDQVTAAGALVRFVYTGSLPDPVPTEQLLLVHMLHLAHLFAVDACKAACYQRLMRCNQLQPEAVGLVFQLFSPLTPSGAAGRAVASPAAAASAAGEFEQLLSHCLDKLQQQLGDMEANLRCPLRLASLHSLPPPALLALLRDDRTSAASENTVLAAVHSWMGAAAQNDVRVDAALREQLAAAVRVPLLEPCYLATVLPRMAWILEILGVQGLALAAGAARGLCDPHAEPTLTNPRACSPLTAGWLQGPRPLPASCSRAMHGGPELCIEWTLPLADIKAAFETTCTAAAVRAKTRWQQQQRAAAAAAAEAQQEVAEATGWSLGFKSPLNASTAAAAVSAVAAAAAAAATSMFNKRKRSREQQDGQGRDQQSSTATSGVVVAGHHGFNGHEDDDKQQQHAATASTPPKRAAASYQALGSPDAGELQQSARKRRRRGAGAAASAAAAAGPQRPMHARDATAACVPHFSPRAAAAAAPSSLSQETSAVAAAAAAAATDGLSFMYEGSQCSGGPAHRPVKLYSQEMQFAGYTWRLVLYFQAKPAATTTAAPAAAAAAGGSGAEQHTQPYYEAEPPGQAVTAAAAVNLPDDDCAPAGAADASAPSNEVLWTARVAVEAWPCMTLQPGISTAAFSGSLAVRVSSARSIRGAGEDDDHDFCGGRGGSGYNSGDEGDGAADVLHLQSHDAQAQLAAAQAAAYERLRQQQPSRGAYAATGSEAAAARRLQRGTVSPARQHGGVQRRQDLGALHEGADAAATAGGSGQSPFGRLQGISRAAHVQQHAATQQQQQQHHYQQQRQQLLAIPESDEEAAASGSQPARRVLEHDDNSNTDDEDDGVMIAGEVAAGSSQPRAAAAADQGHNGSGCSRQLRRQRQQQQQHKHRRSRSGKLCDGAAGVGVLEDGFDDGEQQQGPVQAAAAAAAAESEDGSRWRALHLPQASWLKSRRCDTGFRNFFSITLHQGIWDEAAWRPYLQAGGVLQLKGRIWNVR